MRARAYTGLKNIKKHSEQEVLTPTEASAARKQYLSAKAIARRDNKGIVDGFSWTGIDGIQLQRYDFDAENAARNRIAITSSEGTGGISPAEAIIHDPIKATATGALGVSYAYDQIGTIPIKWTDEEGEEIDPPAWYTSPRMWKPHIDTFYLIASAVEHALCRGEFIWYLWRNEAGDVTEVMPLNTYYVQSYARKDGSTTYKIIGEDDYPDVDKDVELDEWNILHVITNPVPGYERGVSPIQTNDHAVRGAILSKLFGVKWFLQAPTPSMVLYGGEFADHEDEEDTLDTVQDQFREAGNDHSVVMIEGRDIKLEQHQITPATSQLTETEDMNTKSMGKLTRIDPAIQGEHTGTMTKDAVVGQQQHYAASLAIPLLKKICSGMKRICRLGVEPRPDWSGILEGDEVTRHEMYRKDVSVGGMSFAQFAEVTNQKPDWIDEEWANVPWTTGNMVPVPFLYDQAEKASEKEEEEPAPQMMPTDPLQSRIPNSEEIEVEVEA